MRPRFVYFAIWVALCGAVPGYAEGPSEEQVKAAFLFNFARYVEWPATAFESPGAPITIGILGDDDFRPTLEQAVAGRSAWNRPLRVQTYARLEDTAGCHILFIGASSEDQLQAIASSLKGSRVFSMADAPGFARLGGVGNFKIVDERVRFEINPAVAHEGGLKISSQLLRVAELVN